MNGENFSENSNSGEVQLPSVEGRRKKRVFWIIIGAFLALFVLIVGFISWRAFDLWRAEKGAELLSESFKQAAEEKYQRQLADTYGGETPQETLRMYIEAVEAGDYELASRYFVVEKQKEELESLRISPKENLKELVEVLERTKERSKDEIFRSEYESFVDAFDKKDMTFDEYVDFFDLERKYVERDSATMNTKVDGYNFYVSFTLYPNGIWKIEEI